MARRIFAAVWLLCLVGYVFAGVREATFHGDEPMQIAMSRDFTTVFIAGRPSDLTTSPPYAVDGDPWLRILNGSVNRYAIGLSLRLAGYTDRDLPKSPGWDWGQSYEANVAAGHRPNPSVLFAARLPSASFLALSVVVMFALGWKLGGMLPAVVVSGLYALNPVVLLNGRRALMEGSMLFFGLLAVLIAAGIASRSASPRRTIVLGLALAVASGLTLASKHSGVAFVAGAFAWLLLVAVGDALGAGSGRRGKASEGWRRLASALSGLAAAGVLAIAIFVALSPALWNNPPARLVDLVQQRQGLIEAQIGGAGGKPTTLSERLQGVVTEPYLAPVQHFEVASWSRAGEIAAEIRRYDASPFGGIRLGPAVGLALTLLAGLGAIALLVPSLSRGMRWAVGLDAWLLVTVAGLMLNPLPWQRYYLPLIPVATVLVGVAVAALVGVVVRRPSPAATRPPAGRARRG